MLLCRGHCETIELKIEMERCRLLNVENCGYYGGFCQIFAINCEFVQLKFLEIKVNEIFFLSMLQSITISSNLSEFSD